MVLEGGEDVRGTGGETRLGFSLHSLARNETTQITRPLSLPREEVNGQGSSPLLPQPPTTRTRRQVLFSSFKKRQTAVVLL